MLAIDTNVLLRYMLWDDPLQAQKAAQLINGDTPVLITDAVLVETLWTLKGKKYRLAKPEFIEVVSKLFEEPQICFEDAPTVWRALHDYRQATPVKVGGKKKEADFADALIVNKAKYCATHQDVPFEGVYTFDLAAQSLPGTAAP